eukprot:m.55868 g.55868  ORF g.55868 m.55868 type:complete len:114 (+) comp6722_c0_seq1:245-586(+)
MQLRSAIHSRPSGHLGCPAILQLFEALPRFLANEPTPAHLESALRYGVDASEHIMTEFAIHVADEIGSFSRNTRQLDPCERKAGTLTELSLKSHFASALQDFSHGQLRVLHQV